MAAAKEKKIQGYCMKCRKKRNIQDPKEHKMKNGRPAFKGKCPECGTGMFKIASASDVG